MLNRVTNNGEGVAQDRFVAVEKPSEAEGVGRALQAAFRDGFELPTELRECLDRLNRVSN